MASLESCSGRAAQKSYQLVQDLSPSLTARGADWWSVVSMLGNNLMSAAQTTSVVAASQQERGMHDAARMGRAGLPPGDRHIGSILNRGQVQSQEEIDALRSSAKSTQQTRQIRSMALCVVVFLLVRGVVMSFGDLPEITVVPADGRHEFSVRGSSPLKGVWQFAGIRYGTAERWQRPVAAELKGEDQRVVDASEFGPECVQPSTLQMPLLVAWLLPLLLLAAAFAVWRRYLPVPLWLLNKLPVDAALNALGVTQADGPRELELTQPSHVDDEPAPPVPRWSKPERSKRAQRCGACGVCSCILLALIAAVVGSNSTPDSFIGSEDCLFLNVLRQDFTPEPDNLGGAGPSRVPVFVFIHGGDLTSMSGSDFLPYDWVSRKDIVVVTINYR